MILKRKGYKELPYTKENVLKYKSPENLLKHSKVGDDIEGIMFIKGEDLIGYCAWKGDYIVSLEVTKEYRGQGYGKELLSRALDSGCRYLSVRKDNIPAINLYTSSGFYRSRMIGPKMIEMKYGKDNSNV